MAYFRNDAGVMAAIGEHEGEFVVCETALHKALMDARARNQTVVIVSHRPTILTAEDMVLVLRGGQFEAFGPRDEILPHLVNGIQSIPSKNKVKREQSSVSGSGYRKNSRQGARGRYACRALDCCRWGGDRVGVRRHGRLGDKPPTPIGVAFWASVSDEVDKRLMADPGAPLELGAKEWRSGDIVWLVDIVAAPKVSMALVKNIRERVGAGKIMKIRTADKDGTPRVRTIG
jgi:hypothetical protein